MLLKVPVFLLLAAYAACASLPRAGESCPIVCPANYAPVCGSDGKTYGNDCMFHAAQCRDSTLTMAHRGPCEGPVKRGGCTPPWCPPTYNPVCGTDGVTYNNECQLWWAQCVDEHLKVKYNGVCQSSSTPV